MLLIHNSILQRFFQLTTIVLVSGYIVCLTGCKRQTTVERGAGDQEPNVPQLIEPSAVVGEILLREITAQTGVDFTYRNGGEAQENTILETLGNGVAIVDFDLDGNLDLFLPGGGRLENKQVAGHPAALLRNLGAWQFRNVSSLAKTDHDSLYTHGCHVGDLDNDGFPDLLLTGYGSLLLYHNQGDGTFLEIHEQAGLDNKSWSTGAGWGDLNGDGLLDLYICNYVDWSFDKHPVCMSEDGRPDICSPRQFNALADVLYFNNGDGTFRNVSNEPGMVDPEKLEFSKGLGVLLGDVDLDGDLDIYVANDTTPNFLYLNDGQGNFDEVGLVSSVALDSNGGANGSMGLDLGDFNGDQLPDLWVSNYEHESFGLYENQGRGMFLHASDKTGVTKLGGMFVGFGTAFWDLDRDGDEDLLVSNGHVIKYPVSGRMRQLPLLLVNDRGRRFNRQQFPAEQYFSTAHAGRGLAIGDLGGDGRAEIVFANNQERCAIVANETSNENHSVRVRLIGRVLSRDAVGAIATLHTSAGDQLRMVKGGGSYMSQSESRLYWGVPKGVQVSGLTIRWPGGHKQTLRDISLDDTVIILEGEDMSGAGT